MIKSARRYYLLKWRAYACIEGEEALASVYQGKHAAEPATPLPVDFPSRSKLVSANYTAVEDVDGASLQELQRHGLSLGEADAVIQALQAL